MTRREPSDDARDAMGEFLAGAMPGGKERVASGYGREQALWLALRQACRDVIRLETAAGDPDAATNDPQDVAAGYLEEALRRLEAGLPELRSEGEGTQR